MNEKINSPWELWQTHRLPLIIIFIGTLLLGFILRGCFTGPAVQPGQEHGEETQAAAKKNETWTCSMHPQIQQPQFGKCPLCGMDLIVVDTGGDDAGVSAGQLKLTANAITLAAIQTSPVEHRFVATDIRMVGKVANDETRLGYITARIPGRLDRLYVDYTGVAIRKGDRLASLYSPQLIAAQQELLQSLKNFRKFGSGKLVVNAAREKLKLWGLHAKQIRDIEKRGKTVDHLTIYSPMSGIVIHKNAVEGMYVKTGS
ncbi:MAG: efflux RND transporter periplasmic adaptor subunit, partial [bacterium]|nr:efflux RND transporter periplasmic adaptor subunit [bacterium]